MRIDFKRLSAFEGRRGKVAAAVAALLVVLFVAAAVSEAQRRGGRGGRGGFGGGRPAAALLPLRQLDLSVEQREQVRTAVAESREARRDTARAIRGARRALAEAVTADTVDEARIRSLAADLGRLEGDAAVARAGLRAALWRLLTPEQQERAAEIRAEREARREEERESSFLPGELDDYVGLSDVQPWMVHLGLDLFRAAIERLDARSLAIALQAAQRGAGAWYAPVPTFDGVSLERPRDA
ncbi:MAG: Spy/CpxP family protein refolding chaperone [Acidobacteria bacterium]|nr:Spy/CpxP family protein refolding chaperone [Acidobacteriota bacterium]